MVASTKRIMISIKDGQVMEGGKVIGQIDESGNFYRNGKRVGRLTLVKKTKSPKVIPTAPRAEDTLTALSVEEPKSTKAPAGIIALVISVALFLFLAISCLTYKCIERRVTQEKEEKEAAQEIKKTMDKIDSAIKRQIMEEQERERIRELSPNRDMFGLRPTDSTQPRDWSKIRTPLDPYDPEDKPR